MVANSDPKDTVRALADACRSCGRTDRGPIYYGLCGACEQIEAAAASDRPGAVS